ncbi:BC1872 family protein [Brevibacillus fortis]|uniref:BC1872 family protein n=1 Tax=Brevibacillus fortis TaxID=2126352 RepID=UPI0038FC6F0B
MTMTEQQIVETLGTKVMGWEKHEVELDLTDGGTQKFFDSWRMNGNEIATHWRPLHNIADAWIIVEKFKTLRETNYLAYLVFYESIPSSIYAITPRTICDAALEALELVA